MATESALALPLGSPAPAFELADPGGTAHSPVADAAGRPLLVLFLCNHCPYVRHIAAALGERSAQWTADGLAMVGINSNDPSSHPDDAPERMGPFASDHGWVFPYLVDADQEVAKAYGAACTPDVFLSDANHALAYRGQFDATRPGGTEAATGADLDAAVRKVLAGESVPAEGQRPSVGCSIKPKPGNELG